MKNIFEKYEGFVTGLSDVPLLMIRLTLAYGFYTPAMNKWADINAIGEWFAGMNLPAPHVMAYLAATTELLGVFLLSLGLFTRYISIPLMITMVVAIKTVHWENGFNASDNGFEIPFYYFLMLFILLVYGSGRVSADQAVTKWRSARRKLN